MKFIVSSSALLKQLQQISGVINANTVLPILEDFLFEVEKNKLTVVATDLETVMKVHLEVEAKDTGKVCIPAKILIDSLKQEGVDGIVMDMRENGGGSLMEAIELTGLFIKTGPVVQVRDANNQIEQDKDEDPSIAYSGPLAILVDRFSASATA